MMAVLSLIVAALLQGGAPPRGPQEMKTIEKGTDSAVDSAGHFAARTQAEWRKLWRSHSWDRELPKVDFTRDMVVGVFMGSRPTAGFAVELVGTRAEHGTLIVEYRETRPGADAVTAQILTAPFHLATIPKFAGPVKFEKVEKTPGK
jgi:hypothetical protein